MKRYTTSICLLLMVMFTQCRKNEFLGKKPSSNLVVPTSLNDLQALLDNTNVMNFTGSLAHMSCDDYYVSDANFQAAPFATQRNSYIWAKDIYAGELAIRDWNDLYKGVFYANAVLDEIDRSYPNSSPQRNYVKGWALFCRAYSFYDLARNFCKAYHPNTAQDDLGIPLRLTSSIDYRLPRATLQETMDQILSDLNESESLLPPERPSTNLNRPSKIAVYALLARIYLDMGNYSLALQFAQRSLSLYSVLIDYKIVSKTATIPFTVTNEELIFNSTSIPVYAEFLSTSNLGSARINAALIQQYLPNDLRLPIYFGKLADNSYYRKRGYNGSSNYPFTGLATDELYLISAECLARTGEVTLAMNILNQLLVKRWDPAATSPLNAFTPLIAVDAQDALEKILTERRKELVFRGLRWTDLKRLNRDGSNLSLQRTVLGSTYTLRANDPKYVFPIPEDEISISGIIQNLR